MYDPAAAPSPAPLARAERPVLPFERLGALVEIAVCSGFPSQIALIVVLRGLGMKLHLADGSLSPPFLFTVSLLDAAIVIGLVFFFLRAHHEPARDVLLGNRRVAREALLGVALIPLVFILVGVVLVLVLTFAPALHNVPRNPLEAMLQNRGDALMFAVVVMVSGGVREEIQRGFILHRFGQYLGGPYVGVLAYSVLFGLGHIDQGYDAAIATAALGAVWGVIYILRRSVIAPMVSHAGFNIAQLVKYVTVAGL